MGIIREMYYGNIYPGERSFVKGSKYDKEFRTANDIEEELKRLLPDKTDLIDQLQSSNLKMLSLNEVESYEAGFRHGAQFMMDILAGDSLY